MATIEASASSAAALQCMMMLPLYCSFKIVQLKIDTGSKCAPGQHPKP